jgi:hypothetical protein
MPIIGRAAGLRRDCAEKGGTSRERLGAVSGLMAYQQRRLTLGPGDDFGSFGSLALPKSLAPRNWVSAPPRLPSDEQEVIPH